MAVMLMRVKDVMTAHPECLTPEATIKDAAIKMKDINCGFLPMCENDRLTGVITDRDIAVRGVVEDIDLSTKAKDIMTKGVIYCFEDDTLDTAIAKMEANHIRRLVALNKDKRLVGILSVDDIFAKVKDKCLSNIES